MIIRMDWPFANDYLDFFLSTSFFSIFLWSLKQISYVPPKKIVFSFKTFLLLLQILGLRFNLADPSRTICSCLLFGNVSMFSSSNIFAVLLASARAMPSRPKVFWENWYICSDNEIFSIAFVLYTDAGIFLIQELFHCQWFSSKEALSPPFHCQH